MAIILVRPDDYAIFKENDNGTFSHFAYYNLPPSSCQYKKEHLISLGFKEVNDSDPVEMEAIKENQMLYAKFLKWHNRPDGHGGIKGGTITEFLSK